MQVLWLTSISAPNSGSNNTRRGGSGSQMMSVVDTGKVSWCLWTPSLGTGEERWSGNPRPWHVCCGVSSDSLGAPAYTVSAQNEHRKLHKGRQQGYSLEMQMPP